MWKFAWRSRCNTYGGTSIVMVVRWKFQFRILVTLYKPESKFSRSELYFATRKLKYCNIKCNAHFRRLCSCFECLQRRFFRRSIRSPFYRTSWDSKRLDANRRWNTDRGSPRFVYSLRRVRSPSHWYTCSPVLSPGLSDKCHLPKFNLKFKLERTTVWHKTYLI